MRAALLERKPLVVLLPTSVIYPWSSLEIILATHRSPSPLKSRFTRFSKFDGGFVHCWNRYPASVFSSLTGYRISGIFKLVYRHFSKGYVFKSFFPSFSFFPRAHTLSFHCFSSAAILHPPLPPP